MRLIFIIVARVEPTVHSCLPRFFRSLDFFLFFEALLFLRLLFGLAELLLLLFGVNATD